MSIPPLVCSTPPPPDQCEDDKDPEDYDLQYNLSQEEEDDDGVDYGFGNFSAYGNNYETHPSHKQAEVINKEENIVNYNVTFRQNETALENNTNDSISETDNKCEEKSKYDEDINIEDLNLKIDDDTTSFKDIHIEDKPCNSESNNNICLKDSSVEITNIVNVVDCEEVTCSSTNSCIENTTETNNHTTILKSDFIIDEVIDAHSSETDSDEFNSPEKSIETPIDNDFGDFDDFKFIRSDTKPTDVIESTDNPWQNEEIDSSDFGYFTANFEDNEVKSCIAPLEHMEIGTQRRLDDQHHICSSENDFDDFKSSDVKTKTDVTLEESVSAHSVHEINLQSSENEPLVIENINKLLTSIFEEEITESENETEVKLKTLLNETWGFLIETDIRQPYIVNWNNSFGQKTLLRALCIDSRNILFGPRWGYNTPKYAVNLGAAPLQPQKQIVTANVALANEAISVDKSVNKTEPWMDPFSSDGQESCNTGRDCSNIEPRPTDLDVFEATTSKSEKIYPSSIDMQPVRQINLPETHIFTPTDSETPRSKTVHYDCGPPVLLSEPVLENHVIQTENSPFESVNKEKKTEEDEDWEFQDFKCTPSVNTLAPTTSCQTTPSVDKSNEKPSLLTPIQCTEYPTHVLQPIKMEPVIPTLNWPDPGEVKHVFDDFTDFVSNSTWSEKTLVKSDAIKPNSIKPPITDAKIENVKIDKLNHVETTNDNSAFDDDFDTFQSALPIRKQFDEFTLNSSSNNTTSLTTQITNNQVITTSVSNFEHVFQNDSIIKSDPISFTNVTKSNEPFSTNLNFTTNVIDFTSESSLTSALPPQNKILQPTPANTSTLSMCNKQKSGQILQPLSLESYSQINWPGPGIDLQDLSRFNPVDTLHSLKSDLTINGQIKNSPIHNNKNPTNTQLPDDDVWGEFVSSKPKLQQAQVNNNQVFNDDNEWTDFVSSSSIKPLNGLNTISFNVHTNIQKTSKQSKFNKKNDQMPLDIPSLNYITPKANSHKTYNERHFQNL